MIAQFGFDTLAFVKRLSAAGMESRQAEALAEALTGHAFNELATKSDLKNEINDLKAELRSEMKDLELRLTMRMGAMSAASTALTVAILGALITLS
jgi:hypothetical protein